MAPLTHATLSASYVSGGRKVAKRSHVTFLLRYITRSCIYYCPPWSELGHMTGNLRESWEARPSAWTPCTN